MRYVVLTALAAGAFVFLPATAGAYCRTTTVHEQVPWNPVYDGCWTQGVPLAWAGAQRVPYAISATASNQISLADATRVAHDAFNRWNNVTCADGGKINVQAYDAGPISADAAAHDCGLDQCDPTVHDPNHVIVFDDAGWPHNDPNNTLALTTVTYGVDSGEIFDADIEINSAQHTLTVSEPPPQGTYDLEAILTHEAGHFFGMAHATSTSPIMYAQYKVGATNLTQDDIDGVCSAYAPLPKSGCACRSTPTITWRSGAWWLAAGAGLLLLTAARRRRRADRSR